MTFNRCANLLASTCRMNRHRTPRRCSSSAVCSKRTTWRRVFNDINGHLANNGPTMREGTIVDVTLIAAPPSTKNREMERDPEMG